jgi:hypothetical protein
VALRQNRCTKAHAAELILAIRLWRILWGPSITNRISRYPTMRFPSMQKALLRQAFGARGMSPIDPDEKSFRRLGVRVVAGSNPAAPTKSTLL